MQGSSPTEQDKINLPAYQRYGLEQQRGLHHDLTTTPTYPLDPVVPMTESQQTAQRYGTGYAFGDRPLGMQHGAENTLMNMMSGQIDTGPGTPWDSAREARRSRAVRSLKEDILPGIREAMVGVHGPVQEGGGTRPDLIQGLAVSRQQEILDEQDKQMELEAMRMAQERQAFGMSAYGGIMEAPQQFYGGALQAATPEYNVQQAMRTADKAAYDERRANAIAAMNQYSKGIGEISGGFGDISKLKDLGLLTYK